MLGSGMNLYEGNQANSFNTDLFHGPGAIHTLFRNHFSGRDGDKRSNTSPIVIMGYSRSHNIIGNVLGDPSYHLQYETFGTVTNNNLNDPNTNKSIYLLGYTRFGSGLGTFIDGVRLIPYDVRVRDTLYRWGNYDHATKSVRWEASEVPAGQFIPTNQAMPPSLFLSSRPTWWGKTPWPAIGPDVVGGQDPSGHVYDIPATTCYLKTLKDSFGVLNFDARKCYGG
jgi:hypothetical protein